MAAADCICVQFLLESFLQRLSGNFSINDDLERKIYIHTYIYIYINSCI